MNSLTILYQDKWLVAVDKPPGVLVHPSDHPKVDDLVAMKILRDQIDGKVHVIHRLDQPTSGVLVFTKDLFAARKLRQDFEKRRIQKKYLALVHGHPHRSTWTCRIPLRKSPDAPYKSAETSFRILKKNSHQLALVEASPHSGRFHQIRRHLVESGHPIVGDFRYLDNDLCFSTGERLGIGTRMLLQAKSLELLHPITKELLLIEAPIDSHISRLSKS